MKEHMLYKADTTPPRSRKQNISLCFLISISAVILKAMLKITSISPRDLGESLPRRRRRRRRSAFIYLTFIHTHRGTQQICSSQYLFYSENFAGWELRFRLFSWEVKSIKSTVKNLSNVSKILAGGILSL